MFDTLLIANRGEIALRVMRAAKELGLRTVAVYSEADRDALHVRYADAAYLIGGPAATDSYLRGDRIIETARRAGAGAVHPGYGFLAESAAFARACAEAGLVFVGPPPEAMERMGGKVSARNEAVAAAVPVVPGTRAAVSSAAQVAALGAELGYPLAIKASAGGGGRGLRVVTAAGEEERAFDSARREAEAYFGDSEVYVEKYLPDPRHIEIQVLADSRGNVVHLGERDCSIQRRHQKLVEEAPSPALDDATRAAMGEAAVRLARQVGYTGAGTLEFLYQSGQYFFLEMNTRIQVEHTVTEMVTGIDLVRWQLLVAQGARLPWSQAEIRARGHALECRINAEDPAAGFRPSLGTLTRYDEPRGYGVRVDSGYEQGGTIGQYYDSLVAKLITWGADRAEAVARMGRALDDFVIHGVSTTIPFQRLVVGNPAFGRGETTVRFIEQQLGEAELKALAQPEPAGAELLDGGVVREFAVEVDGRRFGVRVAEAPGALPSRPEAGARPRLARDERVRPASPARSTSKPRAGGDADALRSPIQGTVAAVRATPGMAVEAGTVLFVIEAMKMENEIAAPRAGTVKEVLVAERDAVVAGQTLATLDAENAEAREGREFRG